MHMPPAYFSINTGIHGTIHRIKKSKLMLVAPLREKEQTPICAELVHA
ncbi:hypothetical protein BT93_L1874 [Corymbia citriodora subsp. variegata]|uniref:Uncharacterized protein n=1 Tax=Corymbia citriodora subsp. variegata TaxID=360336 RepID=A0A8T0CLP0_CORYI|nr:hypothetical protein BT93_L1874 [Corymbia citriodora subsp. variegata]